MPFSTDAIDTLIEDSLPKALLSARKAITVQTLLPQDSSFEIRSKIDSTLSYITRTLAADYDVFKFQSIHWQLIVNFAQTFDSSLDDTKEIEAARKQQQITLKIKKLLRESSEIPEPAKSNDIRIFAKQILEKQDQGTGPVDKQRLANNLAACYLLFEEKEDRQRLTEKLLSSMASFDGKAIDLTELKLSELQEIRSQAITSQQTDAERPFNIRWSTTAPRILDEVAGDPTLTQQLTSRTSDQIELRPSDMLDAQEVQNVLVYLKKHSHSNDAIYIYQEPLMLDHLDVDKLLSPPSLTEGKAGFIVIDLADSNRNRGHFVNLIIDYKNSQPVSARIGDSCYPTKTPLAQRLEKTLRKHFSDITITVAQTEIAQAGNMCGDLALLDLERQFFGQDCVVYSDTDQRPESIRRQTCVAIAKNQAGTDAELAEYLAKIPSLSAIKSKDTASQSLSTTTTPAADSPTQANKETIQGAQGVLEATVDTKNFSMKLTMLSETAPSKQRMQADLTEILNTLYQRLSKSDSKQWRKTPEGKIIVTVTAENMSNDTVDQLRALIDASGNFITAKTAEANNPLKLFGKQRQRAHGDEPETPKPDSTSSTPSPK